MTQPISYRLDSGADIYPNTDFTIGRTGLSATSPLPEHVINTIVFDDHASPPLWRIDGYGYSSKQAGFADPSWVWTHSNTFSPVHVPAGGSFGLMLTNVSVFGVRCVVTCMGILTSTAQQPFQPPNLPQPSQYQQTPPFQPPHLQQQPMPQAPHLPRFTRR